MADQSTQSIDIAAAPVTVMSVIADFDNYPTWASSVTKAAVLESGPDGRAARVEFDLLAGPVRDTYELHYAWDGNRSVTWKLVRGQMMRSQEGSYLLEPSGAGTKVTYWLSVELVIPMLGQLRRKAERIVMEQALHELKRRVEAIAA